MTAVTKVDQEKVCYVRGGRHGCCSAIRTREAQLQFELVLRTNKLANAVLLQRRCLTCPLGLTIEKVPGMTASRAESLCWLGSGLGGGCQCKQHLDWGWAWGRGWRGGASASSIRTGAGIPAAPNRDTCLPRLQFTSFGLTLNGCGN